MPRLAAPAVAFALWFLTYNVAFGQDGSAEHASAADLPTYLLGLGPLGTIAALAFWLGKGVRLVVQVDLSDVDRKLLERSVEALEQRGSRRRTGDA